MKDNEWKNLQHASDDQPVVWKHSEPFAKNELTIAADVQLRIYKWKGCGLKVHVPGYTDSPPASLDVKMCTFVNHEKIPVVGNLAHDLYEPVSTLYSVKVGKGRLQKQITLEIQHCAPSDIDDGDLVFLHAHNECEGFKPMECVVKKNSAQVRLQPIGQDFSWFIVVVHRYLFRNIQYKAQVYIKSTDRTMYFVITMALDACTMVGIHSKLTDAHTCTTEAKYRIVAPREVILCTFCLL